MSDNFGITLTPAGTNPSSLIGLFSSRSAFGLPGITSLTIKHTSNEQGYDFENTQIATVQSISFPNFQNFTNDAFLTIERFDVLTTLSMPLFISITGNQTLAVIFNPLLTTIDLSSLVTINCSFFSISSNNAITSLSLPSLAACGSFRIQSSPALVTLDLPAMLPNTGAVLTFSGNALNQASVDNALHRCVVGGNNNGTLNVSGGTSSTPSAAGLADKVTLVGRGWTVNNN